AEQAFQNGNTSLVLVEVKKNAESDLTKFFHQIRGYCDLLKTPLGVITNGRSLVLFQQEKFKDTEQIFEATILDLKNRDKAKRLYDLINFERVKQVKNALRNSITYEQHA